MVKLKQPATPEQQDDFNKQLIRMRQDFEDRIAILEARNSLPRTAQITLSASQTTGISVNNHIEFDTIAGSLSDDELVTLSTGSGQVNGVITLEAGHLFKIETVLRVQTPSSNGGGGFRWRSSGSDFSTLVATATPDISVIGNTRALSFPSSPTTMFIIDVTDELSISLDITSLGPGSITNIRTDTQVIITEVL